MLVLDVLHDRVPTSRAVSFNRIEGCWCKIVPSVIVDLITVARSVDNVQPKTDAIFLND